MFKVPQIPDIPGPQGPELIRKISTIQKDPLKFMLKMTELYGQFVQFPIGNLMVYLVNNPELIKHILQDNYRNYTKNTIQYNQLSTITGKGLLTSDGDHWLQQRRLAQPAFHRDLVKEYDTLITNFTVEMLNRWHQSASSQKPIDIDQEMMELTLRIVGKVFLSIDLVKDAEKLTKSVLEALEYIVFRSQNILAPPTFLPTKRNRNFNRSLAEINKLIFSLIQERRTLPNPPDDLLTRLINFQEAEIGKKLGDNEIRDEIITILIAGHETVASALTWCWYLISKYPACQRKIKMEIDQNIGNKIPTSSDLDKLSYVKLIFDETLRLYPPAWLITRRSISADKFFNYRTPEGSLFIISPYVIHRNPNYWINPLGFDPDRFSPSNISKQHKFAYIPFGGGPRLCIGDRFALFEAQLILITILQRFSLALVPSHIVELVPLVTLRPKQGMLMKVIPHS